MKCITPLLSIFAWLYIFTTLAPAQEISLAEAIEAEAALSVVVLSGEFGSPNPEENLVPESHWHAVTDETYDGVDALHVKTAANLEMFAGLKLQLQGPVQVSFQTRVSASDNPAALWYFVKGQQSHRRYFEEKVPHSEGWQQVTFTVQEEEPLSLDINLNDFTGESHEAWLDAFEIKPAKGPEFPPAITQLPEYFPIPLGKTAILRVVAEGVGELGYQWYLDTVLLPEEMESSLTFAATDVTGTHTVQVEVTDDNGSFLSDPVEVEYFSIQEALDTEAVTFSINDSNTDDYTGFYLKDEAAFDGRDAIFLMDVWNPWVPQPPPVNGVSQITAHVKGPTVVSYFSTGWNPLQVSVNGGTPDMRYDEPVDTEAGSWVYTEIPIHESGMNTLTWTISFSSRVYHNKPLDQVSTTRGHRLVEPPKDSAIRRDHKKPLLYRYLGVGQTTHQLLKDESVVFESNAGQLRVSGKDIPGEGTYRIKIINEFNEPLVTDPFEIRFVESIGDALEQPDREWIWDPANPWIPQIFDTFDGEDAVWWTQASHQTSSKLSTTFFGPAFVSFRWKGHRIDFESEENAIRLSNRGAEEWTREHFLVLEPSNTLEWRGYQGTKLDQVEIAFVGLGHPFYLWAYTHLHPTSPIDNMEQVSAEDPDHDGYTNVEEWALHGNPFEPDINHTFEIVLVDGQPYAAFRYTRPSTTRFTTIQLQASSDLRTWEYVELILDETYNEESDTYSVLIRDAVPLDPGKRFVRLRID